jgi:hypothetical protein
METISEQKYIKILKLDHSLDSTPRYARSLEKYLEKNNRSFNIVDGAYIVYVNDKNEAMRMGFELRKYNIEYFDGEELLPLNLESKRNKGGRPKNAVLDYSSGKSMTVSQFMKKTKLDIKLNCLVMGEIIKRKLLTKKEIETAVTWGKLKSVKFKGKEYFDRQELFNYLKSNFRYNTGN